MYEMLYEIMAVTGIVVSLAIAFIGVLFAPELINWWRER